MISEEKTDNEENESGERRQRTDGWSVLEVFDKRINLKSDLNIEFPSKKKRSGEDTKYQSIFGMSQAIIDIDLTDINEKNGLVHEVGDMKMKETVEKEGEGYPHENDDFESDKSIMISKRNSFLKNYEEKYENDEKKTKLKKLIKGSKRKNIMKKSGRKKKRTEKRKSSKTDCIDYEVERIIDMRHLRRGKREFLIRWKGFSANDDTWEPEENLDCNDLMEEYFKTKENRNENETDDEDDMKLSALKKKNTEIDGRRIRRNRFSRIRNGENQNDNIKKRKLHKRVARSSSQLTKNNSSIVISNDNGRGSKDLTKKKMQEKSTNKRKEETESTRKSKRNKMKDHRKVEDRKNNVSIENSIESHDGGMEDAVEYEVEKIIDVRQLKNGSQEFFIKWKGFSHIYNSWEPEKHLNCNYKLKKFLKEKDRIQSSRQLRLERKTTNRFIIESPRSRKLSSRIRRLPPKFYDEQF